MTGTGDAASQITRAFHESQNEKDLNDRRCLRARQVTSSNVLPHGAALAAAALSDDLAPEVATDADESLLTFVSADDAFGVCDLNGNCS